MLNINITKVKARTYELTTPDNIYKKLNIGELKNLLKNIYKDNNITNCINYRKLKEYIKRQNKKKDIYCSFIDEEELLLV